MKLYDITKYDGTRNNYNFGIYYSDKINLFYNTNNHDGHDSHDNRDSHDSHDSNDSPTKFITLKILMYSITNKYINI
jgi:hypothetical protein